MGGTRQSLTLRPADGWPREAILTATPDAAPPLDALAQVDQPAGLAYLGGLAAGYAQRADEVSVETVWSGPGSRHVPVRAPAAVLADVVREARRELLLMTYSARRYQPLTAALQAAVGRGVQVNVVVETLQGAGSALGGDEPYQAFTPVGGIELWHWPTAKQPRRARRCTPSSRWPTGASCSSQARTSRSRVWERTSRRACLSGVAQPRPAPPNMSMPCEQAVT